MNILASSGAVIGVLAVVGQLGRIVMSYLYPRRRDGNWLFVTPVAELKKGGSMEYRTPAGQSVVVSRVGNNGDVQDFIALSNVCPHLGCKVYWEGKTTSFFCPCHNGRFDVVGKPLEGPPAKANQELIKFPLKITQGILYIRVSAESLLRLSSLSKMHQNCSHKGDVVV